MEEIISTIPNGFIPTYFLYIVVGIFLSCYVVLTALYKSKKTNWGNFWVVTFFSTLITSIIIFLLVSKPEFIISKVTEIKSYLS